MAEIRPFRGLRYNPIQVKDLAPFICPPYDVLSIADQRYCYQKNPYNAIRLEQAIIEENQPESKYSYSACLLNDWRGNGILQLEKQPVFYLHLHQFQYQGKEWKRQGLIARVRLEGRESGVVRPHEATLSAAKDDRLHLLRACQANISPIFALYDDDTGEVNSILSDLSKKSPDALSSTDFGESHKLWAITATKQHTRLQSIFKSLFLYIADGHHRYETAMTYRDERRHSLPGFMGEESFNFVMMTLVNTADPGLLILPVHRLVKGVASSTLSRLQKKLRDFFIIEEHGLEAGDSSRLLQLLESMRELSQSGIAVGLYGLKPKTFMILHRKEAIPVELMPPHTSPAYRELEVAVLRHLVIEGILGLGDKDLTYTPQATEAIERVASGEYQMSFLLNPTGVDKLRAVADAGERLPGKSTFFYPKLPTGLVINPLD